MSKKKNKQNNNHCHLLNRLQPRSIKRRDRLLFEQKPRGAPCGFQKRANPYSKVTKLDEANIYKVLHNSCHTIEHQFQMLRCLTVEDNRKKLDNFGKRREFTRCLLECLLNHHGVVYEGVLFGSSVNGLGFIDSDIDLRIRPMMQITKEVLEPVAYDQDMTERVLRNIAYTTTRCCLAAGEFHPSSRCPIAKLIFFNGNRSQMSEEMEESWKYDISLSTSTLGSFNSYYMRFLCHLEPRFHHLAIALKYWAKKHDLVFAGLLSSYAIVNMLIFFCQNTKPQLLPTVDEMRNKYLAVNDSRIAQEIETMQSSQARNDGSPLITPAITQLEWQCLIDLDPDAYQESSNSDPLCLLLLKFFEFYLKFPYLQNIITTRTGKPISFNDFPKSPLFHRQFPLRSYLNIQDPFDLRHNITCGISGKHFLKLMLTMRCSYERLANEIRVNFRNPAHRSMSSKATKNGQSKKQKDWGLNIIFSPLTNEEKEGLL